jgi:hypothetical protein
MLSCVTNAILSSGIFLQPTAVESRMKFQRELVQTANFYEVTYQMRTVSLAFFALAIAFIGVGISGQRTFLYLGIVFLVLASLRLFRSSSKH